MTIDVKEAIIRLKKGFLFDCKGDTTNKDFEALNAAIKALEKQIPEKVIRVNAIYETSCRCPYCESSITEVNFIEICGNECKEPKEKITWCWCCGKAIDWSVEE